MNNSLIPGTTIVYPKPDYQGYTAPPDALILNVAYLVDLDFRRIVRNQKPDIVHDDIFPSLKPEYEAFYADMAKKRLGISFGTEYKFPEGLTARTFQQAFLKCISSRHLRDKTVTETEHHNLEQSFSLLKDLNSDEFKKLDMLNLSEEEKFEVVMGVCSKFTMNDIRHFIQENRICREHDFVPGAQFVMSKETKSKLEGILRQHDTSLAYLTNYIFPEWSKVPDRDIKIQGLWEHPDTMILDEIRQNTGRFFKILNKSSDPEKYAKQFLLLYGRVRNISDDDQKVCDQLSAMRDGKNTLIRQGLSKILDLTQKLPPTKGRKRLKESLVKGYRFFYPKQGSNR